jgi:hypothetical protein
MAFGEEEVDKIVEKLVDDIPLMVLQQTSMMVGGFGGRDSSSFVAWLGKKEGMNGRFWCKRKGTGGGV